MNYRFGESLGARNSTVFWFDIDLTEEQADEIRSFLKENGDCDYAYLEFTHPELFDMINEAATNAALDAINDMRDEGEKLEFDEVDWGSINYDFYWPSELMG